MAGNNVTSCSIAEVDDVVQRCGCSVAGNHVMTYCGSTDLEGHRVRRVTIVAVVVIIKVIITSAMIVIA